MKKVIKLVTVQALTLGVDPKLFNPLITRLETTGTVSQKWVREVIAQERAAHYEHTGYRVALTRVLKSI